MSKETEQAFHRGYLKGIADARDNTVPVDDVKELIKIYSSIMLNPEKAFKEKYASKLEQWFKDHELAETSAAEVKK